MTFTTKPSTYRISCAPTGRGTCRKCKRSISKGAVRLEICAFVRPGRRTVLLRCGGCMDSPLAKAILNVYKTATRVPADPAVDEAAASRVRDSITTSSSSCIG